jgi:hypothetical protein
MRRVTCKCGVKVEAQTRWGQDRQGEPGKVTTEYYYGGKRVRKCPGCGRKLGVAGG